MEHFSDFELLQSGFNSVSAMAFNFFNSSFASHLTMGGTGQWAGPAGPLPEGSCLSMLVTIARIRLLPVLLLHHQLTQIVRPGGIAGTFGNDDFLVQRGHRIVHPRRHAPHGRLGISDSDL